jgi:hypothetical protein
MAEAQSPLLHVHVEGMNDYDYSYVSFARFGRTQGLHYHILVEGN